MIYSCSYMSMINLQHKDRASTKIEKGHQLYNFLFTQYVSKYTDQKSPDALQFHSICAASCSI